MYNAIVWQCRRTADEIDRLKEEGFDRVIRETTGLMPDAYFSGTKIKWILDHVEGAREMAEAGRAAFWYGGYLADLESDEGKGLCDGLYQCVPHHAV